MAITGKSTDYTGRKLDMYISGNLDPLSPATQNVTYSFGNPTRFIGGVEKLVQRYIISLMNSGFVEQLLGSTGSNISKAQTIFAAYNWSIIKKFKAWQISNPDLPLDEQLNTVQAVNIASPSRDAIQFSLQLTTMAGDNIAFTIPLPL